MCFDEDHGCVVVQVRPVARQRGRWSAIHAERAALADDLAVLSEKDWAAPSLWQDLAVQQAWRTR